MGYNQRNDEIRDNIERMRREREAYADALATVEQFNARLAAKKSAWFWPTNRRRAHFKTPLAGHRVRQLRHGD
jgi:hypothetical protein